MNLQRFRTLENRLNKLVTEVVRDGSGLQRIDQFQQQLLNLRIWNHSRIKSGEFFESGFRQSQSYGGPAQSLDGRFKSRNGSRKIFRKLLGITRGIRLGFATLFLLFSILRNLIRLALFVDQGKELRADQFDIGSVEHCDLPRSHHVLLEPLTKRIVDLRRQALPER